MVIVDDVPNWMIGAARPRAAGPLGPVKRVTGGVPAVSAVGQCAGVPSKPCGRRQALVERPGSGSGGRRNGCCAGRHEEGSMLINRITGSGSIVAELVCPGVALAVDWAGARASASPGRAGRASRPGLPPAME